ncbi:hypothetical protein OSB04_019905 [Centaurea solstitialis]|uniref:Retrotransposon gag domain-containing protein n=1 Tax=Centaurea solstitialis TaxID=347529 RepID=A0AA38T9N2_9ASTR|nr:hypothetical protein OSB04_019905 [Centaurea solstitialis]
MRDHEGIVSNVVTYNALIRGLCEDECHWDDVLKTFHEMKAKGPSSDVSWKLFAITGQLTKHSPPSVPWTISRSITTFACTPPSLRDLFEEVGVRGLKHNLRSYTVMIDGFNRAGMTTEAKALFVKMVEAGCQPDSITLNVFFQGLIWIEELEIIDRLFKVLVARGFSPDLRTAHLLSRPQRRRGYDLRTAESLFNDMVQPSTPLSAVEFHASLTSGKSLRLVAAIEANPKQTWEIKDCDMGEDEKKNLRANFLPHNFQRMMYQRLQNLKQGARSVDDYTTEFYKLIARNDIQESEAYLVSRYIGGLRGQIMDSVNLFDP